MNYHHTQHGKLHWLLVPIGLIMIGCAVAFKDDWGAAGAYILAGGAAVIIVMAFGFRDLTVRDEGSQLVIEFGPIPVWRRVIKYADMTNAKAERSTFIDGWGIHYIPSRGWIYNVWGYDCIAIRMGNKHVRIGTDDPDGLTEFLQGKLK
jgi:hypothetical protein